MIEQYCVDNQIPVSLVPVDTPQKAKELLCVFNNFAVCYQGKLETVNLLDIPTLERILKRGSEETS